MPKPAANPRLFVVPRRPKFKRPDPPKRSVESTEQEWIQTHFDLDALLDDEGAENAWPPDPNRRCSHSTHPVRDRLSSDGQDRRPPFRSQDSRYRRLPRAEILSVPHKPRAPNDDA